MMQLAMLLAVVATPATDAAAALQHRQQFPQSEWGYHYYLSTASVAPDHRADLAVAVRLMVASSSLQPIVERCTPQPVTDTLWHVDLRELQWAVDDWHKVLADYPYATARLPIVVRADWLLLQLADQTDSDAYFRLLFGGDRIPKQRDDWLDLLKVSRERSKDFDALRFGLIESESGVAKQDARWMERHPVLGGYAWGTRDILEVAPDADPLEHPAGDFEHDGEEWIVGIPKVSLTTGDRGALQVYALSSGDGKIVAEAPVDLVEDSTTFRQQRAVRNPGSCVQCHTEGLNLPSTNDYRQLIVDGVDVVFYGDKDKQDQIDAFHLGDVERELSRANEDFQAIVRLATGVESAAAVKAFKATVDRFDAALDLDATARELGTTPENWRLAIGYASTQTSTLPARVAGLPHGRTIPRAAWEGIYHEALHRLHAWELRE
jgi:hypothetical protein